MIDGAAFERLKVRTSDDGVVVRLRFDHGKANEIGTRELHELQRLATALRTDPDARALVSWSERRTEKGTPIFVAGANVTERVGWTADQVKAHVGWQRDVLFALRDAPVFHVVVVDGVAFGWGTEFLMTADWRIATGDAKFALPETGLGIVPGAGGTAWLATEIGPAQALRLGMTGEVISAAEAARIGLVQEAVDTFADGMSRALHLAVRASTRSPTANAVFKAAVRASLGRTAEERVAAEVAAYAHCVDSGEAAIGRAGFEASRRGEVVTWGPRTGIGTPGSPDRG